jgi:cell division septation protein DedD
MPRKRIEFSIGIVQFILLGAGGILTLLLSFALGILVGKEMEGIPILEGEVKSQVVRMRIEPLSPIQASVDTSKEEAGPTTMSNFTSKPAITFYDTLTGKKGASAVESPSKRVYTIQVGAMKDRALAEGLASKMKKNGYSASVASSDTSGKVLYKVRLGTFPSREDAVREAERIKKNEGLQAMVVEK